MSDEQIIETMERYGGSFVKCLATLYRLADEENQQRIKAAWPEYWNQCTMMARRLIADYQYAPHPID